MTLNGLRLQAVEPLVVVAHAHRDASRSGETVLHLLGGQRGDRRRRTVTGRAVGQVEAAAAPGGAGSSRGCAPSRPPPGRTPTAEERLRRATVDRLQLVAVKGGRDLERVDEHPLPTRRCQPRQRSGRHGAAGEGVDRQA